MFELKRNRENAAAQRGSANKTMDSAPMQVMKKELRGMSYDQGAAALSPRAPAPEPGKGWLQGLKNNLGLLGELAPQELTEEQRAAFEYVRDMLEPEKLGGADRTFNHADICAVANALVRDTCGLSAEVQKMLRCEGKNFQANLVRKALSGYRGPLVNAARNQVYRDAPGQIRGELRTSLDEGGIDRSTGKEIDPVVRQLTFAELRKFQECAAVLQQMQAEIEERTGMNVTFPGGISQAGVNHSLNGKWGVPPGAKIKRKPKE